MRAPDSAAALAVQKGRTSLRQLGDRRKDLKAKKSGKGRTSLPQPGDKYKDLKAERSGKGRTSLPQPGDTCKDLKAERSRKGWKSLPQPKDKCKDVKTERSRKGRTWQPKKGGPADMLKIESRTPKRGLPLAGMLIFCNGMLQHAPAVFKNN